MKYKKYLKIKECKHQYVIPSINTENVSVFCTKDMDKSKPKNDLLLNGYPECSVNNCKKCTCRQ